jgi:hypothetical protein
MSDKYLVGFSNGGCNVFNNLTISENGAMVIPYGNSSQRPVAPVPGMLRYDISLSTIEYYNNIAWVQLIQYPAINSISPLSVRDNSNGAFDISINITGENFGATPNVYFIGTDSIERQSPAVTDIFSGTQVRATIPTSVYDNSGQEPFAVKVLNNSTGLYVTSISPNLIDINSVPYFITTSPLPDISNGISGSVTLSGQFDISAGDTEDLTLTWSSPAPSPISDIQTGALTLNSSTGAVTGILTNPGSTTTYNFNVKIEDTAGNFHIKLYSFTFTVPVAYTATTTGSNVATIYVDSGNTVTGSATYGGYTIIVFGLTSGTGNTSTNTNTITPSFSSSDIKYLVLGGGGGTPGTNGGSPSGGGGAGGYRTNYSGSLSPNISFVASTSYNISVGGGGSGGAVSNSSGGSNGSASSLAYNGGTITSSGGGKGGYDNRSASAGGSGGGGSLGGSGGSGNSGGYTPSEGNSGGNGDWGSAGTQVGGGGGGASASGASGSPSSSSGGAGGAGLSSTITGTATTRGGGGAGASWASNSRVGGSGGGGNQNTNGLNGFGGGAGGAGNTSQTNVTGKAGGNGIVIVRFPSFSGYS